MNQKALLLSTFLCYCAAVPPLVAQSVTTGTPALLPSTLSALPSLRVHASAAEDGPLQLAQLAPARRPLTDAQRRAMRWGAAAGALGGFLIGMAALPDDCLGFGCAFAPIPVTLATVAGGVVGAGVGLVVGTIIEGRRDPRAYVGLTISLP